MARVARSTSIPVATGERLVPEPLPDQSLDAGRFQVVLSSDPSEVIYATLGRVRVERSVLPVALSDPSTIDKIELSWSRTRSYDVFPLEDICGDFNHDGVLTSDDIDLLSEEILDGGEESILRPQQRRLGQ